MHNFQDLIIWKKAKKLVEDIYQLSSKFPKDGKYGPTGQIRRCTISIPSNIAEGAGKNSEKEFRNFLGIASGSSNELFSQLILSHKLGFVSEKELNPIFEQSGRSTKNQLLVNQKIHIVRNLVSPV